MNNNFRSQNLAFPERTITETITLVLTDNDISANADGLKSGVFLKSQGSGKYGIFADGANATIDGVLAFDLEMPKAAGEVITQRVRGGLLYNESAVSANKITSAAGIDSVLTAAGVSYRVLLEKQGFTIIDSSNVNSI